MAVYDTLLSEAQDKPPLDELARFPACSFFALHTRKRPPHSILVNMKVCKVLALAAFLTFTSSVFADDYMVLDQRAEHFDQWQDRVDGTYGNPVISREFGVPVTVLEEQQSRTQLGYGGLMIANGLATETGRSFDEIVAMKQSGMGWGRIAQENGVKLGPIVSRLNRADREFKKVKIKRTGKPKIKIKERKGRKPGKGHGRGPRGGKGKHK